MAGAWLSLTGCHEPSDLLPTVDSSGGDGVVGGGLQVSATESDHARKKIYSRSIVYVYDYRTLLDFTLLQPV
ncbi:hypothetical protein AWC07_00345 [Mycobacterium gastri]|uniref:Uncharacterized protein n=1 Tax=Mycobacterium gastri TaxID=1777 RepID=A0A1X1VQ41_MYCGS|nr:hypothetical protein AWC07_00345 [Mycobacterium gastri]